MCNISYVKRLCDIREIYSEKISEFHLKKWIEVALPSFTPKCQTPLLPQRKSKNYVAHYLKRIRAKQQKNR